MATAAFKSTTKRNPISSDDSSTSSANRSSASQHRRARSLSRFSRRLPDPPDSEPTPQPRKGRFVNTVRGSGFPEISLDDLAIDFFHSPKGTSAFNTGGGGDRGRSAKRGDDVSSNGNITASQRRGRSVSRHGLSSSKSTTVGSCRSGGGKETSDNSRRRRSVSVVRCQISNSESDRDLSQNSSNRANLKSSINSNSQKPISHTPTASSNRKGLRRSFSQKDLKYHDGYSSQSSALTDDEGGDSHSSRNGTERTIRAVYAQKKADHPTGDDTNGGLYEAMRKELRYAVKEIKMELEQAVTKPNPAVLSSGDCLQSRDSDVLQAVSATRRNYSTKLEQLLKSEKRKQDLLAEIVLEEQRGREISDVVNEFLSGPKDTVEEKPYRARKRSNDKTRMSKRLNEEAEKYFEDFISNVEETDISSIDGERSDTTSSSLGGVTKPEAYQSPVPPKPLPVEMDGVVLPWLQWETTHDASPLSYNNKSLPKAIQRNSLGNGTQGASRAQDLCNLSTSSHGSSSSGIANGFSMINRKDSESKCGESGSFRSKLSSSGVKVLQYDIDEYLTAQPDEDILFERWRQRQRIGSGSLLLCNQMRF